MYEELAWFNLQGKLASDRQNEWFALLQLAKEFRFFPYKG